MHNKTLTWWDIPIYWSTKNSLRDRGIPEETYLRAQCGKKKRMIQKAYTFYFKTWRCKKSWMLMHVCLHLLTDFQLVITQAINPRCSTGCYLWRTERQAQQELGSPTLIDQFYVFNYFVYFADSLLLWCSLDYWFQRLTKKKLFKKAKF